MQLSSLEEAIGNVGKGLKNKYGDPQLNKNLFEKFSGEAKTIEDFWETFIKERLPKKEVVLAWHRMLMEYLDNEPVLAIRSGAVSGKLRRGMLTETDAGFSFFYTDNDLALYIYKMALDGFCPTCAEFSRAMKEFHPVNQIRWIGEKKTIPYNVDAERKEERKFAGFPVHFNRSGGKDEDAKETQLNAFIINGPTPAIGRSGYKHAHLFDAGDNYYIDGREEGITSLCEKYFPLGEIKDWVWDSEKGNYCRHLHVDDKEKTLKIAKALFLRFVDPLNFFLSPNQHEFTNNLPKSNQQNSKDVAEYVPLLNYIISKYSELYGPDYEEYIASICAKKEDTVNGAEVINIRYASSKKIDRTKLINCLIDYEKKCPGIIASAADSDISEIEELSEEELVDIANNLLDCCDEEFDDIAKKLGGIINP